MATVPKPFVPTQTADGNTIHEIKVHTTQGELSFADPINTHILQPEAAAASAFDTYPPNTPMAASSHADTVFGPKISSTDLYSAALSPTSQYENAPENAPTSTEDSSNTNKTTSASTEIPIQRETDLRDEILRESLKYVGEKGWTMEAIRAGVRASNQPTTVEGLFSNGYDLVEYFIRDANAKMNTYMNEKSKK
jgi:hypothetical protein